MIGPGPGTNGRGIAPRRTGTEPTPMECTTRRFGLGDMLILVAALAAETSGARELWRMQVEEPGSSWWPVTPSWLMAAAVGATIATPLTVACLLFRIRRPRHLVGGAGEVLVVVQGAGQEQGRVEDQRPEGAAGWSRRPGGVRIAHGGPPRRSKVVKYPRLETGRAPPSIPRQLVGLRLLQRYSIMSGI
jgi:hypothetical protein